MRAMKTCKNCGRTLTLPSGASQAEKEAYDQDACYRLYLSVMQVEGTKPCQGKEAQRASS